MALKKTRDRIYVRGLGNLTVLQTEPTVGYKFESAGTLQGTVLTDARETEIIKTETGSVVDIVEKERLVTIESQLQQSGIDEITLMKDAAGKVYAMRYYGKLGTIGKWQYYVMDQARIEPGIKATFQSGLRTLPLKLTALYQPDLAYIVQEFNVLEFDAVMYPDGVGLWIDPQLELNLATDRILDVSGFGRHGQLTGTGLWNAVLTPSPTRMLRLGGASDAVNFGNVLNDNATGDFIFEAWVRMTGANGTAEEILTKKSLISDNSAGWSISRNASNQLAVRVSSGSASATATSTATLLQNVWNHIAATVDRNGNITPYVNGAASGTPVSVAAIGTGTNALNLYLGRDGTNYGQFDCGAVRVDLFPNTLAGEDLPSTAALQIASHYAGEKADYGL